MIKELCVRVYTTDLYELKGLTKMYIKTPEMPGPYQSAMPIIIIIFFCDWAPLVAWGRKLGLCQKS